MTDQVIFDRRSVPQEATVNRQSAAMNATVDRRTAAQSVTVTPDGKPRPNIFVLILDDIGVEMFAEYDALNQTMGINTNGGNPWPYPATPTIDAERARGVMFTEFYAHATCSPFRYAMHTGRYGLRTGMGDVVQPFHANAAGYLEAGSLTGAPEITLADLVHVRGYKSALVGKNHMGDFISNGGTGGPYVRNVLHHDVFRGTIQNTNSDPDLVTPINGVELGYWLYRWFDSEDGSFPTIENQYVAVRQRNNIKGTINTVFGGGPWLMIMAAHAAHTPLGRDDDSDFSGALPGKSDGEIDAVTTSGSAAFPYANDGDPEVNKWKAFRASIEALDLQLDSIINGANGLKATGQYDNTVFMIVGDNGQATSTMNYALNTGEDIQNPYATILASGLLKGSVYRQGARAPLFVSGPGYVVGGTPNRTSSIRIDAVDLFSTIREIVGVTQAELVGTKLIDGISFLPSLWHEDADATHARDFNHIEAFRPNGNPFDLVNGGASPLGAVHRWDAAMMANYSGDGRHYAYISTIAGTEFFYDLTADPLQIAPLATSGGAFDELKARLVALRAEV